MKNNCYAYLIYFRYITSLTLHMKAAKAASRTFGQEFRKINWSTCLDQKADLMKRNTAIDFPLVNTQKTELAKILDTVSQKKKRTVITAWNNSCHTESECARQRYTDKYKPSLVTLVSSFGLSIVFMVPILPDCGLSALPYMFSFFFTVSYGTQQLERTMVLREAYKKEVASDFICGITELDDDVSPSKKHK